MGFQTRILLSMLLVIVLALAGTMYVAWDFAGDQEEAYNARRLVRKEASVERSLNYTLDRLPDSLGTEDIPTLFLTAFVSWRTSTAWTLRCTVLTVNY